MRGSSSPFGTLLDKRDSVLWPEAITEIPMGFCSVDPISRTLWNALLVYDVTRRQSFLNLEKVWMDEVQMHNNIEGSIKMIIGNKVDLVWVFLYVFFTLFFYFEFRSLIVKWRLKKVRILRPEQVVCFWKQVPRTTPQFHWHLRNSWRRLRTLQVSWNQTFIELHLDHTNVKIVDVVESES